MWRVDPDARRRSEDRRSALHHLWSIRYWLRLWLGQGLYLAILDLGALRVGGREEFVRCPGPANQDDRAQHDREDHILVIFHRNSILLRYRVGALAAPWVTPTNTFQGHPAAAHGPIAFQRGDGIGRAARLVTAAWREHPRRPLLPGLG